MTLRQYLITMFMATILCWSSWIFVLFTIDPFQGSAIGFSFFYATLFFSLIGTNALFIFVLYRLFLGRSQPFFKYVRASFRDACILAAIVTVLLFLQGQQWLTLWSFGLFICFAIVIGLFLLSIKRSNVGMG